MPETHSLEVTGFLLSMGLVLLAARGLGEIARRFRQPQVLGELLAGILLGATVLGRVAPDLHGFLFPASGPTAEMFDGVRLLAVTLFLLVAGLEIDLASLLRQRGLAAMVSLGGILVPFVLGAGAGFYAPAALGREAGIDPLVFALFLGAALSISALPVVARTLIDLRIYRTDLGSVVMAAAVMDDVVGWLLFGAVLGLAGSGTGAPLEPVGTALATLGFGVAMLTVVPWLVHRALPWVQALTAWPGGVLSFVAVFALASAAFTEWLGVHALFGAFLAGVAFGGSPRLRPRVRRAMEDIVTSLLAPLFFGTLALGVDFVRGFDPVLVLVVLGIASAGKLLGAGGTALLGGASRSTAFAIGFAMNSRGAMEIIFALLALQAGIIGERLFVALVVMALVTSTAAGSLVGAVLHRPRIRRFTEWLEPGCFVADLPAGTPAEAIRALAEAAAPVSGVETEAVAAAAVAREKLMPTGLGHGVAAPHARLDGLEAPLVAIGLSKEGIPFVSPDRSKAHVVCLILTPADDQGAQLKIVADLARTFRDPSAAERIAALGSWPDFLAWANAEGRDDGAHG